MAKTPSDKLFRLIHALSPAEKRYFRIFIRGKTDRDSKYLQLFDAIDAMESFDETTLKDRIYQGKPVEGKKYSELKAYLYELLLKCLQAYDEQQSVEYRLNQLLQSVSVLYKRGHYADCREQLAKAARLARQYEYFFHELDIISWEKQLAYTRMDADFLHKHLEYLHSEEVRLLEQVRNLTGYRRAFFQVYATIKREAQHRADDRMERLNALIGQQLFESPDLATSHKARVYYYRALNLYYYATLQYDLFYESGHKLINLLESQPHFLKENLSDYIAALSNMILSCGVLRKYDEVRFFLQKLRNVEPITLDDQHKIHRQYYSHMFALCTYTGEFEEARAEMLRYQQESAEFGLDEHGTGSFLGQYCYICFGCGDYEAALDYLNQWFNQSKTVEREDLQSLARILSLIVHFEMGNTMLLESLLRSTTRFMQKKNRLYDLERRIIHFMAELMRLPATRERLPAVRKMKQELQDKSLLPGVQALLQAFDFDAWLDSKIRGAPFADVVREKFRQEAATE